METVSKPERVKAFLVLGRTLQAEGDEVTATHKVRRRHVLAKFERELDALYAGSDASRDYLGE